MGAAALEEAVETAAKIPVTIDRSDPEAGRGGVIPPPATRFRPGVAVPGAGRPKGSATSLAAAFERELERLVAGDPLLDKGRVTRRTKLVRAVLSAVERDPNGAAARLLLDRLWPVQVPEEARTVVLHFDSQDACS